MKMAEKMFAKLVQLKQTYKSLSCMQLSPQVLACVAQVGLIKFSFSQSRSDKIYALVSQGHLKLSL